MLLPVQVVAIFVLACARCSLGFCKRAAASQRSHYPKNCGKLGPEHGPCVVATES